MVKVGTLCRAATDTIEESWRVNEELSDEKGEIGTGVVSHSSNALRR